MYLYKPVFLLIVNDHIIVGADARSEPWTNVYDPLVAMSFVAAHTSHIGVGVSVLIMPYRNPIGTANVDRHGIRALTHFRCSRRL